MIDEESIDSLILTTPKSIAYVKSLVPDRNLQLLFRTSRDGWNNVTFHSKCDDMGATITLFKTEEGRICGGYASVSWESMESSSSYKEDKECFIFSVDCERVFKIKLSKYALGCWNGWGPQFGSCSLFGYLFTKGQCRSNEDSDVFENLKDSDGNSMLSGCSK